jgi:hypothetical protein
LFGLELDVWDTGYGHKRKQVASVKVGAELLVGYHDAVFAKTTQYLMRVSTDALDQVVDRRFDPPVTLGVRLVSVVSDDLQHVGQAAFLRGLIERLRTGVESG